jgi:hypothetical protein
MRRLHRSRAEAAASAAVVGKASFRTICETLLGFLSEHGVVSAPVKGAVSSLSPVKIDIALVIWGAVVHRAKKVNVKSERPGVEAGEKTRTHQLVSYRAENWNRFELALPLPSVGGLNLYAELDIRLDLTPWAQELINYMRAKENQKRVDMCFECVRNGTAFCDLSKPLGTLWKQSMDECVSDTEEEQISCLSVVVEHDGVESVADFYRGDPNLCSRLDFPRSNSEGVEGDGVNMFLNRFAAQKLAFEDDADRWKPSLPGGGLQNHSEGSIDKFLWLGALFFLVVFLAWGIKTFGKDFQDGFCQGCRRSLRRVYQGTRQKVAADEPVSKTVEMITFSPRSRIGECYQNRNLSSDESSPSYSKSGTGSSKEMSFEDSNWSHRTGRSGGKKTSVPPPQWAGWDGERSRSKTDSEMGTIRQQGRHTGGGNDFVSHSRPPPHLEQPALGCMQDLSSISGAPGSHVMSPVSAGINNPYNQWQTHIAAPGAPDDRRGRATTHSVQSASRSRQYTSHILHHMDPTP